MKTKLKVASLAGLGIAALMSASLTLADKDDLRAIAAAKISLIDAIQRAEADQGGKAFEAGIDDDSFRPEFEVSIVRDNQIFDVRVDAENGEIIGVREDSDD